MREQFRELLKYLEADGITVEHLEQRCSDEDLLQISRDLVEWRNLAPHLALTDTDLEDLEGGRSEQERRLKALRKWKRKAGFTATYKNLVSALLQVGDTELAEKLCRQLQRRAHKSDIRQQGALARSWLARLQGACAFRRSRRCVFVLVSVCVLCTCVYVSLISYSHVKESKHYEKLQKISGGAAPPHLEMAFPPVDLVMDEFEQHKKSNAEWFSEPFYTHPRGYKMCLSVNAKGWGDGEDSHVSVYIHLMKGEFDDSLKWPFQGDVTIQLLNQLGDGGHHQDTFSFSNSTGSARFAGRVTAGERGAAWGNRQFIPNFQLTYNAKKNRQYLKDGDLCFRVSKVVMHNS